MFTASIKNKPISTREIDALNTNIELFHTASFSGKEAAVQELIKNQISFTQRIIPIPFYLRKKFHNIQTIYQITINPNYYAQARYLIDGMAPYVKRHLVLSNY